MTERVVTENPTTLLIIAGVMIQTALIDFFCNFFRVQSVVGQHTL